MHRGDTYLNTCSYCAKFNSAFPANGSSRDVDTSNKVSQHNIEQIRTKRATWVLFVHSRRTADKWFLWWNGYLHFHHRGHPKWLLARRFRCPQTTPQNKLRPQIGIFPLPPLVLGCVAMLFGALRIPLDLVSGPLNPLETESKVWCRWFIHNDANKLRDANALV